MGMRLTWPISSLREAREDSPVPSWVGQGSCGVPPRQSEGGVLRRWSSLLARNAARSFEVVSFLETRPVPRIGAVPSTHEVLRDASFVSASRWSARDARFQLVFLDV